MRKGTSYEIALSAISAAIYTLALTVGTLYPPFLFTGYLLASVALMLPISEKYYLGCALAYLATCFLTLVFNGFNFWDTLPFILFFGLHPLVNALQKRFRVNKILATIVKAAWFDGAMYLTWRFVFSMNTSIPPVDKYFLPILLVVGTLFFILYDYATMRCQETVDITVERTFRGGKK
jgi:hypothetical protein